MTRGIRTGSQYLHGLRDDREVWSGGKRILDVTDGSIGRGAQTLASFLDRQHNPEKKHILTYQDNDDDTCAIAFKIPQSKDDIKARGRAYFEWATWSYGMFGRTPDYKNASLMAFAAAKEFLALGTKGQTDFAANMVAYYNKIRKGDKVLTHTLVNPSLSHQLAKDGKFSSDVALHVVKEQDDGIIVKGARLLATLGPFSDEIEVFPSTVLTSTPDNIPFAFAFALPIATPGLKLICRDSYDHQKSHFDAPLSSRFEEQDAVVIFDNVFVPWERIFMYGEPELCNQAFTATNAVVHMAHQVACAKLAKAEFLTGIMCKIADATGKNKDLAVKSLIAEVMMMTETVRALLFSAEEQAHQDQYGHTIPLRLPLDTSRNLFPKMYPRMVEILQILGSSSLMATPSEADFSNTISDDVLQYFQLTHLDSRSRVALYRLAHDVCISSFGNRQVLYERFFFGPPILMHSAYYELYDKQKIMKPVEDLICENNHVQ